MKTTILKMKKTILIESVNPIVFPKGGVVWAP
jgi:hypothetical protein